METPSKSSSLSRMALGALDVNQHLGAKSPHTHTTPKKMPSPARKSFVYQDTPAKPVYSLKDSSFSYTSPRPLSAKEREYGVWAKSPRPAVEQTPVRSEKRKDAPTSAVRNQQDAERAVKQARLSQPPQGHSRQSSASGHGHKLFGEITTPAEEETNPSQGTIANSSFSDEEMADASQLTTISAPDHDGLVAPKGSGSPDELRQNAQALKLRLQFAMYKLQTHQEHIPMSHVKVVATRHRYPNVVSSPRLTPTRDASRATSPARSPVAPRSASNDRRAGHSRTPSASKSPGSDRRAPAASSQATIAQDIGGDETENEEDGEDDRDTVSPEQRPRVGDSTYGSMGGRASLRSLGVKTAAERQDRLLSLVDAIEAAGKQTSRCL